MAGSFYSPLYELKEYADLNKDLCQGEGPVSVCGGTDSEKVYAMSALMPNEKLKLIVTYGESRAQEIYEDYRVYDKNVWLYPARDLLFYHADLQSSQLTGRRMAVIRQLLEEKSGTIVTTVDALMNHMMPLADILEHVIFLEAGQIVELDELLKELVFLGYERCAQVEKAGEFCVRGGILDIFPLTEENPVRIEFWDDEIDSIRSFDAGSQRSIEVMKDVRIYPSRELILTQEVFQKGLGKLKKEKDEAAKKFRDSGRPEEAHRLETIIGEMVQELEEGTFVGVLDPLIHYFCKKTVTFLDYFGPEVPVFVDEPGRVSEKAENVEAEFRESMQQRLEKGYLLAGQTDIIVSSTRIMQELGRSRTACFSLLEHKGIPVKKHFFVTVKNAASYTHGFELLVNDLKKWKKEGYRVVLYCSSRTRGERLAKDLRDQYELHTYFSEKEEQTIVPGEICIMYGNLRKGFEYPLIKFVVIHETDMFGAEKKKKKKNSQYEGKKLRGFGDLAVGDFVVHERHGIGIYRGIEKIEVDRITKDYIKVEYANNGNLFIPVTQLDMIQKYAGAGAKKPKINKLGGQEWNKTTTRVRSAVKDIAKDLVELYAHRRDSDGFRYSEDTVWQREFEELFPYEETEDQLAAIEATKADMESSKIMDRLVCGDVGYGKTEIAIRAAFKAIQDGKQVVYLVPTTILAQQHYNTFCQRMMNYPVRVDLLSRFRTATEVKKTLEDLKKGLVDVVIGTHRVLSKDVQFKDLGLLIIDEEQRFGVTHKEKIKQLKENIDVLTLTATPIPRTLHMSLVGIRDMSVLEEPPIDRVPIQTYVLEYNEEMVREAIERERSRGGQVFFVHNRVKDIEEVTARLQQLVPDANVIYAHGKMEERKLEKIMLDFINGEIDVLVSTTIIETGLDISNVNTIIIHDADRFGLSQLYQLRGRVGRSNRMAYAFLMYKRNKILKEEAEKRLSAIREYTELGSGIRIAMRDLEIRGAGNLLGAEQHGHMEAIGYDLYCKMLNDAVRFLKGEKTEEESFETVIDYTIDAFIPSSYIRNEAQKMEIYKRISSIESEEEALDIQDELTDRFGDMPRPVLNLVEIALLKGAAHQAFVSEINGNKQEVRFSFYEKAPFHVEHFPELIKKYNGALKLSPGKVPMLTFTDRRKENIEPRQMLEKVKNLLMDIKELLL